MSEEAPKKARGGRKPGSRNRAKPEPSYAPQIHVEVGKARYACHEIKEEGHCFTLVTYGPGYVETRCVAKEGTLVRRPWQPPQPQLQLMPQARAAQIPYYSSTGANHLTMSGQTSGGDSAWFNPSPPGPPPSFQTNLMPTTSEALVTAAANNGGFSAGMLDS